MSAGFSFSDDVCRARYDQIAFAAQRRCQRDDGVPVVAGDDATTISGHGDDDVGAGSAFSRERRWLLELGAMAVLESELETLTVGDVSSAAAATARRGNRNKNRSSGNNISNNNNSSRTNNNSSNSTTMRGRERAWYKSCLEAMLDDHYDTLSELRVWHHDVIYTLFLVHQQQ